MGVTSALVFANLGAAYGTAKSGVGIASMGATWTNRWNEPGKNGDQTPAMVVYDIVLLTLYVWGL